MFRVNSTRPLTLRGAFALDPELYEVSLFAVMYFKKNEWDKAGEWLPGRRSQPGSRDGLSLLGRRSNEGQNRRRFPAEIR